MAQQVDFQCAGDECICEADRAYVAAFYSSLWSEACALIDKLESGIWFWRFKLPKRVARGIHRDAVECLDDVQWFIEHLGFDHDIDRIVEAWDALRAAGWRQHLFD